LLTRENSVKNIMDEQVIFIKCRRQEKIMVKTKKAPDGTAGSLYYQWSGRQDLNLRPLVPQTISLAFRSISYLSILLRNILTLLKILSNFMSMVFHGILPPIRYKLVANVVARKQGTRA
jgi:hypothetical protein